MGEQQQTTQNDRDSLMRLRRREWVVLAIALALTLLAYANIKRVEVKGISMAPTFHSGDTLFVWRTVPPASLKPGDVIVFRSADGDDLIKRIVFIARPGASGQFPPPGFPAIVREPDGTPLNEDVSFGSYFYGVRAHAVPAPPRANTIYVMGDNALHSDDSRDFGPIAPSQILGRVLFR